MSSPLQAEFFGEQLRIVLPLGVTVVDIGPDVYSQWKEWAKLGANIRFPPAFRTVGGDPLTPGIDAGAYYFQNNTDGWRIRPAEANATVLITGNLAPEDPELPLAVPTLGGYTVLLLGLQPITQSVSTLLELQQSTAFDGAVSIDTLGGGTAGTSWPIGTTSEPSSNLADALLIAAREGISRFFVRGPITLTSSLLGYEFSGLSAESLDIITLNSQDVSGSRFTNCTIIGPAAALSPTSGTINALGCNLSMIANLNGVFRDCGIEDEFKFTSGRTVMHRTFSEIAGLGKPTYDFDGQPADVSMRGYDGGADFINCTHADARMSVDCNSGAPRVNASCTAGQFVFRGVGDLTNNTGGTEVVKDGWVDGKDVKIIKAMVSGNAVVSLDDLTVTVYDPDSTGSPQTVLATFDISVDGRVRIRTS